MAQDTRPAPMEHGDTAPAAAPRGNLAIAMASTLGDLFGCSYQDGHGLHEEDSSPVLLEGPVEKRSRHLGVWRGRWAVLTHRSFSTFEVRGDATRGVPPTELVPLADLLDVVYNGKDGIELRTAASTCALRFFGDTATAEKWHRHLTSHATNLSSNAPAPVPRPAAPVGEDDPSDLR
eukprot:gnl/TRDRNA2_/TRDRNA2_200103_c0_seq1.p2 gnl/TRDRNA2_/TRDRNA2_200103_c0~~gnl/TRDRNA2_/TRDRNA2_200103_c0_seq1.p2  ORF type:complete len:177 (+),score=24.11 gnl/TRDRNA2_/TRDRNA2_200103_c0_seq1:80-610(+)